MTEQHHQAEVGRFHQLQAEVAPRRRKPYQLTADIAIPPVTRGQLLALRAESDEDRQIAIVLGEQREAVEALFADRPMEEWAAFAYDLYAYLFGQGATDVPGGSQGS